MMLLFRQTARRHGVELGWSLGEMDLIEWMERENVKPGSPRMKEFFAARREGDG